MRDFLPMLWGFGLAKYSCDPSARVVGHFREIKSRLVQATAPVPVPDEINHISQRSGCWGRTLSAGFGMLALMLVTPAFAADLSNPEAVPPAQKEWRVIVTSYVWGAALNGNTSLLGFPANVNVPFDETLKNLDFAIMGNVEITNGKFGAFVDGQYADVSKDETIRSVHIGTGMQTTNLSAGVYYRMFETKLGGNTSFGTPRTFNIEPTVGVRWTKMSAELEGLGRHLSASESWTDPFIGTRMSVDLSSRWNLAMEGDVGGFGAGTRLSLGGQAYLGYRTKMFGHDSLVRVGYRALYQDYESKDFDWEVTQHGPVVGISTRF